ncbi:hypothetical protein [Flavobacterium sp. N3904]|uniref:hypothetical protein n=1 Tax=Flavobacterium sp. N3904 TaxID=2986835 RepID=UPI002225AE51|nr:hypothetical protein [Flavobacterium sp. N3904]
MKVKLPVALFLFLYQVSFSQTEKPLKGILSSDGFLLKNVDVINKTSKKSTITNDKGEFVIEAKANDSLYFYAKEYYIKRLKVTSEDINLNYLIVSMLKKPEELEEVVIRRVATSGISWEGDAKNKQEKRDDLAAQKTASKLNTGVYDGAMVNGPDFGRIGGMILGLFIKEKEPPVEKSPDIEFAVLAKKTCNEKFYLQTLKLKPDQIELFLQFCDADPKSKTLIKHSNILSMMDFLTNKNIEFQKLKN